MENVKLYDYWRSSSSQRVRIALNLVGVDYERVPINLLAGQQRSPQNLARNRQGLVPTLHWDGIDFVQSLAIIEYLNEARPKVALLPPDSLGRSRVRALSYVVAMDIHPICNLRAVKEVLRLTEGGDGVRQEWMRKFILEGLAAFEAMLDDSATGAFCHGDNPTMADACLIPQVYNARRWNLDISAFKKIVEIDAHCSTLPAFIDAEPRGETS